MDLKSGCLYWPGAGGRQIAALPLQADSECDVVVIGAGVSGALAAFHLAEAGADVIVVDRRKPACGSTAASTGLLQYEIDTLLVELADQIGRDRAERAYHVSLQALVAFEPLVARLDDDCGLLTRPSLYLAADTRDLELFHAEYRARRQINIEVELLLQKQVQTLFGFDRPVALYSHLAAEIDPYRLTLALHRASIARGTRGFAETQIDRYEPDQAGVTLTTSEGARVRARNVIFATGYETPEFVDRSLCTLKSTYALATEPVGRPPLWHDQCLIWEHRDPYFYVRSTQDGRVMIGGEDIDSADPETRDRLIPEKSRALVADFRKLFPDLPVTPACAWAGTFAETKDGLPYIGSLPEFPHGYFALGYGGNGITFSLIAARIIRDLILGHENPDAELFRFGR